MLQLLGIQDNWGEEADENMVSYLQFKSQNKDRQAILYVGSNDGMLHGFNADTGVELFAYIPSVLYPRLADLVEIDYVHQYYVDESAVVSDAFF